jgi:ligand-binding sensor domain-containing protein
MKKSISLAILAFMVGTTLTLVGCADKNEDPGTSGLYAESADSAVRDINGLGPAESPASALLAASVQVGAEAAPTFNDLYASGDSVFAAHGKGLTIYNVKTGEYAEAAVDDNLWTMAVHEGNLYVGGDKLYRLVGAELQEVDNVVSGPINELQSFGPSLMIGTDSGLYAYDLTQTVQLFQGLDITALASDGAGLWVGTNGDGLFRWDGDFLQKRFLTRDSTLFDNVSALAYGHGHLYLGTDKGMYVYDGGKWETVSVEQGMPSDEIVSINADGWVVYVGTAGGAVTWYQQAVTPVKQLDEKIVTAFCRAGNRVIAGTLYDGLAIKNGRAISFVTAPWSSETRDLATALQ